MSATANGVASPRQYAASYHDAGLSVIPIRADGTKAPAVGGWKAYQEDLPTVQEIDRNFLADNVGKRAGVERWSRLWHSMRSTRQTELVERFPVHVVCAWLGNTIDVAATHYLKTTEQHFDEASKVVRQQTEVAQKAAQPVTARGRLGQQEDFDESTETQ